MAALLWAGPEALASHRSAAALLGLAGIDTKPVELTVPKPRMAPESRIIIHRSDVMPECDVARVEPFLLSSATRTVIDLAAVLDEEALEMTLDSALRLRLTSIPRLQWRLRQLGGKGRPGAKVLAGLIAARDRKGAAPHSELETRFSRFCRKYRLPRPVCQLPVGRFFIDFAYPEAKIAIEMDSARWHMDAQAMHRDRVKQNHLVAKGWLVLRFMWADLKNDPERLAAEIRRAFGLRG